MPAPARPHLQRALLDIRQAAERLKVYDVALVDALEARFRDCNAGLEAAAAGLPAETRAAVIRILAQIRAVQECIARARTYPAHIMARADLLDRSGMLAKMIGDFLAAYSPQRL